ncbi:TadE/TadG family type IV pilus assembly protein [Sinimarinibacterium sp. NLF-5-8]|uniref:TadE/TadG family type IV pilus assembly protein n=1 Tax=Sinimarinibacterium sp. NLF-5-8 TaxID=2698684 RepID=UPI00137BB94B|nr:TadE family protein [Sinimarinibacterium sp. NLF-5-8]QHS09980.1 pilus assembly protein [Sinimarinibacterium sp. NLF-5-8]
MRYRTARHCAQKGAAAIEFAFILPLLLVMLYGIVTFGDLFYTQMTLSRAVGDGARAVTLLPRHEVDPENLEAQRPLIETELVRSLALSVVSGVLGGGNYEQRQQRIRDLSDSVVQIGTGDCSGADDDAYFFHVRVTYPFDQLRMLPPIKLPLVGDTLSWMPTQLVSCAAAQL